MSADVLRRAAALMRERAEAATPGQWLADDDPTGNVIAPDTPNFTWDGIFICSTQIDKHGEPNMADAAHIASWHPAVALAVADWLGDEARVNDGLTNPQHYSSFRKALAVARAYLGGDA